MTLVRETFVPAPVLTATPSGILDHFPARENSGFGWRNQCGLWPSYGEVDTRVPTQLCPDDLVEKDFETVPWVNSFSFAVYGGVKCKLVGLTRAEQQAELAKVFALRESAGVEMALMGTGFVANNEDAGSGSDAENVCGWEAATDLTPGGGAVSAKVALAILEGWMGDAYAGLPTIHAPRTVASFLASDSAITLVGNQMYTYLGSRFINGAGYDPSTGPSGSTPAAGEYWMYASGDVVIEAGELVSLDSVVLPGDGSSEDSNTALSLVERMFRVAVDGPRAAVRVEIF